MAGRVQGWAGVEPVEQVGDGAVVRLSVIGRAGADERSELAVDMHEVARSGCGVGIGDGLPGRTGEAVRAAGRLSAWPTMVRGFMEQSMVSDHVIMSMFLSCRVCSWLWGQCGGQETSTPTAAPPVVDKCGRWGGAVDY